LEAVTRRCVECAQAEIADDVQPPACEG